MPHSPALWPPYRWPETSRLLQVNHYVLHLRIMMRSGGCVAFSQNTDTDTGCGGVVRGSWGRSVTKGSAVLTSVCVLAFKMACIAH
jgi:hypothetical protein